MKIIPTVSILVILCISGIYCESNYTKVESNSSCVPAEPVVNASTKNAACIFYNYTVKDGICRNSISSLYIFGDSATLKYGEVQVEKMQRFFREVKSIEISEQCEPIMIDLFCRYHFPPCDTSLARPHARRLCRVSCARLVHGLCEKEMEFFREAIKAVPGLLDENMLNCSLYDTSNGGDSPECYQYHTVPGDDTKSTDCYYGIGVGYRGNVSITRSGLTCQAWKSQCPHRHWRIPEDVKDGQNDSNNACRNPDSSAPDGPWCYTADPNVRWEYCNVSRCPPRVPEEAPSSLKGYSLNSTAILISWKSLPPSRHKEQLLGYRIKYRRLASQAYKEVNISSNHTETVLTGLAAQTDYEIQITGFNEIGHGPASKFLLVKTVSAGEVAVDLNVQLVMDEDFNNDLLNRTSKRFKAMEEKIRTAIMRHYNESSVLKIVDIRVLKFSMGSVEADLAVLAVINSNTTKKDEALSHLVEGLDSRILEGLNVSAIRVLENPQPPNDFRATVVQTRYMVLQWKPPKYGNFYGIQNYTIEQKKGPSGNFIVIETLPYSRTGMTMEGLEPSTEYTIRVSSNNNYGRSEGALLTQGTLSDKFIRDLMLIIVLPLTLAVVFILVVCIKTRPCSKPKPETQIQFPMQISGGDWLEFAPSDVKLQEKLGEGAFGEAYKGLVRIDNQWCECAVKKVKVNATERERRDLINELQIMVTVGEHPNVISLIGACTRSGPILVVVRLAENGCLLTHLKKTRKNPYVGDTTPDCSQIDKIRIARDVANGMLHLATKKCVHRDLAARNVLLGKNNVAMVSDFGMSRDVYESGEYETTSGGMLPIRWMALETLEDYTYKYDTKTDVWSFGVVLWEIQSGGKTPYSGIGGMELVDFIKSGERLRQPDGCPDEIYKMMLSCWDPDPSERPSFSDLLRSLEQELFNRGDFQGNINFSAEVDSHKESNTSF